MGKDGAKGTVEVKEMMNNYCSGQDTCVIYGMPKVALETGHVDYVVPIDKIASKIQSLISNK